MTINQMRRFLYDLARILGDINAIQRGPSAIIRRILRKKMGRTFGKFNNRH